MEEIKICSYCCKEYIQDFNSKSTYNENICENCQKYYKTITDEVNKEICDLCHSFCYSTNYCSYCINCKKPFHYQDRTVVTNKNYINNELLCLRCITKLKYKPKL